MANVTKNIGLSLGADLCWPACYEEIVKRLDLNIPYGDDAIKFLQTGKNIYIQGVVGAWSASKVKAIQVDTGAGNDFVSFNSWADGGNKGLSDFATVRGGAGE